MADNKLWKGYFLFIFLEEIFSDDFGKRASGVGVREKKRVYFFPLSHSTPLQLGRLDEMKDACTERYPTENFPLTKRTLIPLILRGNTDKSQEVLN